MQTVEALSFLDEKVAQELKVQVVETSVITVTVADGSKVYSKGTSLGFKRRIQGQTFSFDNILLAMGSFDVILGVDWMKAHNPFLFDFQQSVISFPKQGALIFLKGLGESEARVEQPHCVSHS